MSRSSPNLDLMRRGAETEWMGWGKPVGKTSEAISSLHSQKIWSPKYSIRVDYCKVNNREKGVVSWPKAYQQLFLHNPSTLGERPLGQRMPKADISEENRFRVGPRRRRIRNSPIAGDLHAIPKPSALSASDLAQGFVWDRHSWDYESLRVAVREKPMCPICR